MGDVTCGCPNAQMEFRLETARPRAALAALWRCGGAPAPSDVLLERHAKECGDDATAGDKCAA